MRSSAARKPRGGSNFYELLTEAVNDLAAHGYDSEERVAEWVSRLRRAAEESLISEAVAEERLRTSLGAIYRRLVDEEGVLKTMPGVSRFTLQKIKPQLRAELDRRLMASANLIKLNRDEAIETTLRRFQGWATSIPVGGTADPQRTKTKKDVRKALANMPFIERRVAIDQGHKLAAAINRSVAAGSGAIAAEWHSHWRQAGYHYREDHKERDGAVYLIRDSWAHQRGYVKPGPAGYLDDVTQPGEEVFCRCWATYLFALKRLPDEMLTNAGREAMARAAEMAKAA